MSEIHFFKRVILNETTVGIPLEESNEKRTLIKFYKNVKTNQSSGNFNYHYKNKVDKHSAPFLNDILLLYSLYFGFILINKSQFFKWKFVLQNNIAEK